MSSMLNPSSGFHRHESTGTTQNLRFPVSSRRNISGLTDAAKNAAVAALEPIAAELGGSTSQLALAWAASHPQVSSVIMGASRLDQLHANLGALSLLDKMTPEVKARIEAVTQPLADLA